MRTAHAVSPPVILAFVFGHHLCLTPRHRAAMPSAKWRARVRLGRAPGSHAWRTFFQVHVIQRSESGLLRVHPAKRTAASPPALVPVSSLLIAATGTALMIHTKTLPMHSIIMAQLVPSAFRSACQTHPRCRISRRRHFLANVSNLPTSRENKKRSTKCMFPWSHPTPNVTNRIESLVYTA